MYILELIVQKDYQGNELARAYWSCVDLRYRTHLIELGLNQGEKMITHIMWQIGFWAIHLHIYQKF